MATLGNFQRVRGMLRLLAQAVANLWHQRPTATYAMHLHHLDPGFGLTREEIVTRLEMRALDPAIRNDVSAPESAASLAQQIDAKDFSGMAPVGSFVARTILWHTLAFNEHLKGASVEELRYAIGAPGITSPSSTRPGRSSWTPRRTWTTDPARASGSSPRRTSP